MLYSKFIDRTTITLDKEDKLRTKQWFDDECNRQMEARARARLRMLEGKTDETVRIYKEQRRVCKKIHREGKGI